MYQGGSPAGVSLGPDLRVQLPLRLPGWNRVGSLKAQGCPPLGLPRCQSLSPGDGRVVDGHCSAPWAATHEASLQIQATAIATCSSGGAGRCLRLRRRALRASPIFTEWEWLRATRRPPRPGVDIDGQLRATAGESRWTPCSWGLHWGLCPSEKRWCGRWFGVSALGVTEGDREPGPFAKWSARATPLHCCPGPPRAPP